MSETEKKRRFAVGRFDERHNFFLEIAKVFATAEEAKVAAIKAVRNWAVFRLDEFVEGIHYDTSKNRIILPFAATTESIHGGEVIYHREGMRLWDGMKLSPLDSTYYMTVIDHAGKEEEKEDFVMGFIPGQTGWVLRNEYFADSKLGWVDGEYRVKIQLPVNREVPREQR